MLKRFLLSMTFLAAFTTLSVGVTDSAEAWGRWTNRPYVAYYGAGPRPYYSGYTPYRTYYGPRVYRPNYYGRYYANSYYYDDPYYYGPRGRVAFSIGF
jgi:hypothetical protein